MTLLRMILALLLNLHVIIIAIITLSTTPGSRGFSFSFRGRLRQQEGRFATAFQQQQYDGVPRQRSRGSCYSTLLSVFCSSRPSSSFTTAVEGNEKNVDEQQQTQQQQQQQQSHICSIRSFNLAGAIAGADDNQEIISLELSKAGRQNNNNLIAVTGETGSGKSLLVAKVVELLTGGKATSSLLGGDVGDIHVFPNYCSNETSFLDKSSSSSMMNQTAFVEMELLIRGPHLTWVRSMFERIGLDLDSLNDDVTASDECERESGRRIRFRRALSVQPSSWGSKGGGKPRLKSICQVNGQQVTLKVLTSLAGPLLTTVDATTAAGALSKPDARMAILDTAVSEDCLARVHHAKQIYRQCRQRRQQLEDELASRTLPQSFSSDYDADGEKDLELLSHWIDELDAFETRISKFCESLVVMVSDVPAEDSVLSAAGRELVSTSWRDSSSSAGQPFSSLLFERLTRFRGILASMDSQMSSAQAALGALASLSSPHSAVTAVELARNHLFDCCATSGGETTSSKLDDAAERSHELLNAVETALSKCAQFLEDDDSGLISTLEYERSVCPVTIDEVDALLLDWNTLARKHGISPFSLPACHFGLKSERDGSVEARTLLPKAVAEEQRALKNFEEACQDLTEERLEIASRLSEVVTRRFPSLGMEHSVFRANLNPNVRQCTDFSVYETGVWRDTVDFMLLHGEQTKGVKNRGGPVHEVASSGEKARILLAIECALPGSVGASCGAATAENLGFSSSLPPVAVLYDEIDAHVGGHAAVSLASMLADQSLSSQVITITHSPSVAAVADLHMVVNKLSQAGEGGSFLVRVSAVEGLERRKELARMASGDLAVEEAELFADALIRDGAKRRMTKSSL